MISDFGDPAQFPNPAPEGLSGSLLIGCVGGVCQVNGAGVRTLVNDFNNPALGPTGLGMPALAIVP